MPQHSNGEGAPWAHHHLRFISSLWGEVNYATVSLFFKQSPQKMT